MNKNIETSGLEFSVENGKLNYNKTEYAPAVEWDKTFEAGKYAYARPETELTMLYFGNRYMEKTTDEQVFLDNDFMADLTIINPGKVGDEFIKTVGHYHGNVPGTNVAYPEVYQAVDEHVEYLLQGIPDSDGKIEVIWVVTEPGDIVIFPPGYGHVSMNTGTKPAAEIDLQKRDNPNQSDYTMFKEKVGGALYRTEAGLVENPNYDIKSVRIVRPLEKPDWGITFGKPVYTSLVENPEKFQWLLAPQDYEFNLDELFEDIEL